MNRVLKITLSSFIILFLLAISIVSIYIIQERSFVSSDDLTIQSEETIENQSSDYTVGLIGDSWVAGEKLDEHIVSYFSNQDVDVEIDSVGFPGLKSKEILEQFETQEIQSMLNNEAIEHIVLSAGINDSAGHIGSDYYAHHMNEIVEIINEHDKTPIVLELPEYGIEEPKPLKSSIKHGIYRYLFDSGEKDVIDEYREELTSTLNNDDYELITFDYITNDFHQDQQIYIDNFHLNDEGNEKLGEYIAENLYELTD